MAKEEKVEFEGEVVEALPNAMFRVKLDNDHMVLGHVAGKMRRFRIRILRATACASSCRRTTSTARASSTATGSASATRGRVRAHRRPRAAPRRRARTASCAAAATTPRSSARARSRSPRVDAMVDGVHFRLGDTARRRPTPATARSPRALSDLAAMGADPGEAYVALGLPAGFGDDDVLALAARRWRRSPRARGTTIAGGDVTRAPALTIAVTVVGWADDADAARRPRRRARPATSSA